MRPVEIILCAENGSVLNANIAISSVQVNYTGRLHLRTTPCQMNRLLPPALTRSQYSLSV
jgi:hypothetical protein